MKRRTPWYVCTLAAALVAGAGGCASPFVKAVGDFAAVTEASAPEIASAPVTAGRLCLRAARLSFLEKRLLAGLPAPPEDVTATANLPWSASMAKATVTPTGKETWKQYCDAFEPAGKLQRSGVQTIREYARALGALAEHASYDGASLQGAADSAGSIAASLGRSDIEAAIKPVGGLAAKLAAAIVARAVEGKLVALVAEADPTVQAILNTLDAYDQAVQGVYDNAMRFQHNALNAAETRAGLVGGAADPGKLIEFFAVATAMDDEAREVQAILQGHRDALAAMRAAHTALLKASKGGRRVDVLAAIAAVRTLLESVQELESALEKEG